MTNTLIFVDLPVDDVEAAHKFYEELFGWTINPRPAGVFHQIVPDEGLHLGLYENKIQYPNPTPDPELASKPRGLQARTYILIDNAVSHYMDKATELGATKLWDEGWWPEFGGWHAAFADPWGNEIVLWENVGTRAKRLGISEDEVERA